MELAEWKLGGMVAIPYLKPKQQIQEVSQLTYYKPAGGEEGGPRKKAKEYQVAISKGMFLLPTIGIAGQRYEIFV